MMFDPGFVFDWSKHSLCFGLKRKSLSSRISVCRCDRDCAATRQRHWPACLSVCVCVCVCLFAVLLHLATLLSRLTHADCMHGSGRCLGRSITARRHGSSSPTHTHTHPPRPSSERAARCRTHIGPVACTPPLPSAAMSHAPDAPQCTLLLSYDSPLQLQKESEFMEKLESKDEEIKVNGREQGMNG